MIDPGIIRYLEDEYDPLSIMVYGSYAAGTEDEYSDFDCLLIVDEKKREHDSSVICGVRLDCHIFTSFDTYGEDIDPFLTCYDAVIMKDRYGAARTLKERVRRYVEEHSVTDEKEKETIRLWTEKTLMRIRKRDDDGNYRAIALLEVSLEDYFRLRDMFYFGSSKAVAWLRENDPEGYSLFHSAVTMRTNSSIESWARYVISS